ncbi:MAG: N-acetylneuraminate synthase family protein [Planctomycetes bacterium]|nr:N-acetylneuraminate synthase family protein [Planctomycetota bacterium]
MKQKQKPYIIGETAYNHEGDIDYLYRMIDEIAEVGLNAVKFHLLLNPESYMQKTHPAIPEIKKWIFDENQWDAIIDHSNKKGLDVIALCDDVESLEYINKSKLDVYAVELHATGLNDYFLLEAAVEFGETIILGVGGSTIGEIEYAIEFLKTRQKDDIVLIYGFQDYPTDYAKINLSKMLKIAALFDLPVGYADHTAFNDPNNEVVSVMAAMMGFNILEKHYTPDFGAKRIDHHAAVGKEQMIKIKGLMELALTVHGSGGMKMSKAELEYGNTGPMKKAIVARKDIKKGQKLSPDDLWFKRTEQQSPIRQSQFLQLIGLEVIRDIDEDEIIDYSNVRYNFQKADIESFTHLDNTGDSQ